MAALEVVELQELIQIGLDFIGGLVPLLSTLAAEVLIQQGSVHSLHEAVGPG